MTLVLVKLGQVFFYYRFHFMQRPFSLLFKKERKEEVKEMKKNYDVDFRK